VCEQVFCKSWFGLGRWGVACATFLTVLECSFDKLGYVLCMQKGWRWLCVLLFGDIF
jgi:hypothetical protein